MFLFFYKLLIIFFEIIIWRLIRPIYKNTNIYLPKIRLAYIDQIS